MSLVKIPQGSGREGVEVTLKDSKGNDIDPNNYNEARINIIDDSKSVKTEYSSNPTSGEFPLTQNVGSLTFDLLAAETANYNNGKIFLDVWLNDSANYTPLAFPRIEFAQITSSSI